MIALPLGIQHGSARSQPILGDVGVDSPPDLLTRRCTVHWSELGVSVDHCLPGKLPDGTTIRQDLIRAVCRTGLEDLDLLLLKVSLRHSG